MNCSLHLHRGSDDLIELIHQYRFLESIGPTSKMLSARNFGMPLSPETTFEQVCKALGEFSFVFRQAVNNGENIQAVVKWGNGDLGILSYYPAHIDVGVVSERESCEETFGAIVKNLLAFKAKNKRDDGVWIDFTNEQGNSVNRTTQFLHCPTWKDIEKNYPPSVRLKMDAILGLKRPWQNGRMMVWYGPPGTGKTYALRALLMAWKRTFDFIVVTDPERLAANPAYYYDVASKPAKNSHIRANEDEESEGPDEPHFAKRRVLFVLEDSADLIIKESRTSHYDKIGKLLNITDGLIGQGREDIFLVTFNEEIDSIDPAFLRPGRCLAQVEFGALEKADAQAWLGARGVESVASDRMTLAQLYGQLAKADCKVDLIGAPGSGARIALR